MAMKQEANALLILTMGAISGLMMLILYFGVEAWFRSEESAELDARWANSPNTQLQTLRDGQQSHLSGIGDAMKKVIETGAKCPNS